MARVLLVHHSPSPATERLAAAARAGLSMPELEDIEVVERPALEATAADVLAADAYVLGTTANFGYISGALKHFFDTTYYATREQTAGRPFCYWIHGGYDTTGAEKAMEAITTGFGWQKAHAPIAFTGEVGEEHLGQVTEMAATVAATVM
ncbi:flavodoxin family protein [Brevibacterium otitidis]|uniref:Flavodoxin family protein n=1 Tax=Brevibacterium otitidis TaxID=53364 RepID=A0ABV5WZ24_9MICO|nr:NAD(P)H-dependent oxidoreductase [Brevibacterium otitidis]